MGQRVQQHIGTARERAFSLAIRHPEPVPGRKALEPPRDRRPREPLVHGRRANLEKHPFTAILHRGKPLRLQRELRPLDVGFVFPVDVGRHGLEAREPDERQDLAQPVELDDRFNAVETTRAAPRSIRQAARVEVRIHRHVVAKALGRGENRLELDLLDGPLAFPTALDRTNDLEDFIVGEGLELLRDLRKALEYGQRIDGVHGLQETPQLSHGRLHGRPPIREREHAHHLREVRVGSRADEQTARELAVLVRVPAKPWPRTAAGAERVHLDRRRFIQTARPAALAAHDEVGQVAARAAFVEPELPPAVVRGVLMREAAPVDVVHVPLWAGPDEARGHDLAAIEAALLVERLAVDQPAGALAVLAAGGFLHDEPLRKPPGAYAPRGLAGIVGVGGRREQTGRGDARHGLELARQPGLDDLLEVARLRPGLEATDDRRVPGQVDQRPGPVGGDHLAAADLPVRLAAHAPFSTWMPLRSFRNRFTSGSTSRSERFARNFRWCSDSNSVSSISRRSGLGCFSSYFWYCMATPAAW